MEESPSSIALGGKVTSISFSLATRQEICKSSISDCAITHASQLSNPFLGLPLEVGKCESCGTSEPGQCEGHFGYLELPIPIYHPDHVGELKRLLSLLCLKCLKIKNRKFQVKNVGVLERMLSSCCEEASQVAVNEVKTTDGACYLELKVPSRTKLQENFWSFLEKYGFRYGDSYCRPLLPSEVVIILKKISADTRKKLSAKGYFPQDGYILQYLPVPPNCLSVPDISDGTNIMSKDHSISLLKRVLKQIEVIKNSRSGMPNFESHHIEANDLQASVAQYFEFRGTGKASRDVDTRFGVSKESNTSSTKAWLEKMKTLFIRKGSGFSSRSVITGDPYKGVNEIGLPFEIAQRITFEERVSQHNMNYLQKLVDEKLCLTYRDGMSTYSLREGSKGHTFLRPGQVVHRRIMDGDMVFINRPPTTHKHSLQALSVYIHDDHTVKINPLICGPLSADFDGDCIHLFYPQSLAARAEVLELFSVEKQLLSSHTGNFNLQLATDSLLSIKLMFVRYLFDRVTAEQLAMFVPLSLPKPAIIKNSSSGPFWTVLQLLQTALPPSFDSSGERYLTYKSQMVKIDCNRDLVQSIFIDIITAVLFSKGPKEVLRFFNYLTPLLMENLYSEGFSVCLEDFYIPKSTLEAVQASVQNVSSLLYHMRSTQSESIQLQLESYLRGVKSPISNFILNSSAMGYIIDCKSESALSKVVQQIGFLGNQISNKGKYYSRTLVSDLAQLFQKKYPSRGHYPSEEFGLVRSCLFYGLDPYQEMIHSISSREVIVRSTRGLTEPGTLFKNLMAILRDVVICYDGTVRNMCSNSVIQFEYGVNYGISFNSEFGAGEPVGVLAATAMSNPAYKAVLDSSPSSNSSWEMMKEILLCGVNFKNEVSDRRVILYLKECGCGRNYCRENAAYVVKNQLRKVSLKDAATELLIEYGQNSVYESSEIDTGLVGHIHLNEALLKSSNISMNEVLSKCEDTISLFRKRKKVGGVFKRVILGVSDYCSFRQSYNSKSVEVPCLRFIWQEASDDHLERRSHVLAETICPALFETVIKGDPRVSTANIIWINPDTPAWIRSPCKSQKGELALDVVLEKDAVKQTGDAWRVVMDSCLPVIHLIDTNRSIPYAIKQVQELLGISCAFEQAVQRLSTSVMMVTKGVLKDHLVLLANSMTCAGNLIGFNIGGIKALSRSLNVQVPFTEATLSAPRKCFERAAEKCHVDSLSSVVASCSWGKHVAVGTGSPFDILLDTKKVELNQQDGVDVYDFLQLVRDTTGGEETSTACLGVEIENLDLEDEAMRIDLSPVRDSDQPTFEDRHEFDESIQREFGWERDGPQTAELTGGWEHANEAQNTGARGIASDSAWSSWGSGAVGKEGSFSKTAKEGSPSFGEWTSKEPHTLKQSGLSSTWGKKVDYELDSPQTTELSSGWEQVNKVKNTGASKIASDSAWSSWGSGAVGNEGSFSKTEKEDSPRYNEWNSKEPQSLKQSGSNAWGKKVDYERDSPLAAKTSGNWEQATDKAENVGTSRITSDSGWSSGGTGHVEEEVSDSNRVLENSPKYGEWFGKETRSIGKQPGSSSAWRKTDSSWNSPLTDKSSGVRDWTIDKGQNVAAQTTASDSAWSSRHGGQFIKEDSFFSMRIENSSNHGEWGGTEKHQDTAKQSGSSSAWEKFDSETGSPLTSKSSGGWEHATDKAQNLVSHTTALDSTWSSWGGGESGKEDKSVRGNAPSFGEWGAKESESTGNQSGSSSAWGQKVLHNEVWSKKDGHNISAIATAPKHLSKRDIDAVQGEDILPKGAEEGSWKSGGEVEFKNDGEMKKSAGAHNWDNKRDTQSQWGPRKWLKGDANESSRGWSSPTHGEWKNQRNRPAKAIDSFSTTGTFTLTKQRMDRFTVEEQDILLDIEQMMQNIRRIIHQTGYNDGDPLSADDQSFVIDNVLNFHPDKSLKIGAGIKYITVSKHASFQDSRCFYVVSTDDHKQDFSYRKSLDNFVRVKYPDKAEGFLAKYFSKNQPRPGWSRERPSKTSDEAGTQQEQ
ncbi:hypothetical protein ACH5RR_001129 [Cinchona calisaya]|uniref:DNA-directed RNA polymerase subunit n=1 Tax=Cinchona calisaya TaxID=153742 RepID=A0ABD3B368_9GENT